MAPRDRKDVTVTPATGSVAELKIRVRGDLRPQLEESAARHGTTLNAEIVRRLEASFKLEADLATVLEALEVSEQHRAEAQVQAYRLTNLLLEQWPKIRAQPQAKEDSK